MTDSSRRPLLVPVPSCAGARLLDTETLLGLVRELRATSGSRLFAPPVEWALLAGFEVAFAEVLPPDHLWDGTTLFHVFTPGARERGWMEYQGLARVFLISRGVAHLPADVRRFALALAVPFEVRSHSAERIAASQPHCPLEVIREALADSR